jgi:uncharacterized protein
MKPLAAGIGVIALIGAIALGIVVSQLPAYGAGALLYPSRHPNVTATPTACVDRKFTGEGVTLDGWFCASTAPEHQGTIVYLHGVADNRGSSLATIQIFTPLGFDVIAYDSRAHGTSDGERCTYGFFEKRDLQRVLDQLAIKDVVLIGHSLGGAVALQTAAIEPRVRAVVAASTFSDLRTIASERAFGLPAWSLGPAFTRAEHDATFVVDEVSPMKAAAQLRVPVLLIHGADDRDTVPSHSQRVFEALHEPKQIIVVPNASHNDVLRPHVWDQIQTWLNSSLPK